MKLVFTIDEEQCKKLGEWTKAMIIKKEDPTAIGGRFVYSFCNTDIGSVVKVKDDLTGEEIDLTDYDSW